MEMQTIEKENRFMSTIAIGIFIAFAILIVTFLFILCIRLYMSSVSAASQQSIEYEDQNERFAYFMVASLVLTSIAFLFILSYVISISSIIACLVVLIPTILNIRISDNNVIKKINIAYLVLLCLIISVCVCNIVLLALR